MVYVGYLLILALVLWVVLEISSTPLGLLLPVALLYVVCTLVPSADWPRWMNRR